MISRGEIEHIAVLAHLKLTDDEIELFTKQLGDIVDYFDKLQEMDTGDIIPTAYTIPMRNVLREDEVEPSYDRDQVLANAPDKKDGQFRVPPIIGE